MTTLKKGQVVRVRLDGTRTRVIGRPQPMLRTRNRYRDIVVSWVLRKAL